MQQYIEKVLDKHQKDLARLKADRRRFFLSGHEEMARLIQHTISFQRRSIAALVSWLRQEHEDLLMEEIRYQRIMTEMPRVVSHLCDNTGVPYEAMLNSARNSGFDYL